MTLDQSKCHPSYRVYDETNLEALYQDFMRGHVTPSAQVVHKLCKDTVSTMATEASFETSVETSAEASVKASSKQSQQPALPPILGSVIERRVRITAKSANAPSKSDASWPQTRPSIGSINALSNINSIKDREDGDHGKNAAHRDRKAIAAENIAKIEAMPTQEIIAAREFLHKTLPPAFLAKMLAKENSTSP